MQLKLSSSACLVAFLLSLVSCDKDLPTSDPDPQQTPVPTTPAIARCDNSNRPRVVARLVAVGTLSQARKGMSTVAVGNKILFAGAAVREGNEYGSSRVDIYDLGTQTWSKAELSEERSDISTVVAGNKVFFAGGRLGDGAFDNLYDNVDIYDATTNTWTVSHLSQPRAYIAAAAAGNKVLFAGGERNHNYETSTVVDIYDLSTGTWSVDLLSEARAHMAGVAVHNKLYFAGGHKDNRWYNQPSRNIDVYDAATGTWSTSSLKVPMGFLSGIAVGNSIYWTVDCLVEIKNVLTGSSTPAFLFKARDYQNVVVQNNKIIYWAGNDTLFDIYDTATDSWFIGELPENIGSASIVSANNAIYLAGVGKPNEYSTQVYKLEF